MTSLKLRLLLVLGALGPSITVGYLARANKRDTPRPLSRRVIGQHFVGSGRQLRKDHGPTDVRRTGRAAALLVAELGPRPALTLELRRPFGRRSESNRGARAVRRRLSRSLAGGISCYSRSFGIRISFRHGPRFPDLVEAPISGLSQPWALLATVSPLQCTLNIAAHHLPRIIPMKR